MSTPKDYPKRPYIGVDCSGQPKMPPMIAVATRWSRRQKQNKWIAQVKKEKISEYRRKYRDWQEKLYAALFFKVIDEILVPHYEIHIDKEFPKHKTELKVYEYLKHLFGMIHSGDINKENPKISFHTKKHSEYVRHADKKTKWARDHKMKIDDKNATVDWLIRLLE